MWVFVLHLVLFVHSRTPKSPLTQPKYQLVVFNSLKLHFDKFMQWTFINPWESTSSLSLCPPPLSMPCTCIGRAYLFVILCRFSVLLLLCNWNCTKRFCEQSTIIGYEWAKNNNGNELRETREKETEEIWHLVACAFRKREREIVGERKRDGESIQNE